MVWSAMAPSIALLRRSNSLRSSPLRFFSPSRTPAPTRTNPLLSGMKPGGHLVKSSHTSRRSSSAATGKRERSRPTTLCPSVNARAPAPPARVAGAGARALTLGQSVSDSDLSRLPVAALDDLRLVWDDFTRWPPASSREPRVCTRRGRCPAGREEPQRAGSWRLGPSERVIDGAIADQTTRWPSGADPAGLGVTSRTGKDGGQPAHRRGREGWAARPGTTQPALGPVRLGRPVHSKPAELQSGGRRPLAGTRTRSSRPAKGCLRPAARWPEGFDPR